MANKNHSKVSQQMIAVDLREKSLMEYWDSCKRHLQVSLPLSLYESMIAPLQASLVKDAQTKQLKLTAPDKEIASRVSERYLPVIEDFLRTTPLQGQIAVLVNSASALEPASRLREDIKKSPDQKEHASYEYHASGTKQNALGSSQVHTWQSKSRMAEPERDCCIVTQGSFCISSKKRRQIELLWRKPQGLRYLWGEAGRGKSTIGSAFAYHCQHKLALSSRFLRFEGFLTEFVAAANNRDSTSWRKRLYSYDCLVIDDLQYIKAGAKRSQEELLYLIDSFLEKKKSLVFCSTCPAQKLPLSSSLLSRLQAAQMIELPQLRTKEREELIRQESRLKGLQLSQETSHYLSSCIKHDMRLLKSAVQRLHEHYLDTADGRDLQKLDYYHIDSICSDLYTNQKQVGAEELLLAVASHYRISPDSMRGPARDRKYVMARHVMAYLCTEKLGLSLKETASLIGRKDHGSVIHARKKIQKLIAEDMFLARQIHGIFLALQEECSRHH